MQRPAQRATHHNHGRTVAASDAPVRPAAVSAGKASLL